MKPNQKQTTRLSADQHLFVEDRTQTKVNIEEAIKEALKAEDFRLALRYRFHHVLYLMASNGDIVYAQDKTNRDYRREIAEKQYADIFVTVSRLFELYWYGKINITKAGYDDATVQFSQLSKQLEG